MSTLAWIIIAIIAMILGGCAGAALYLWRKIGEIE